MATEVASAARYVGRFQVTPRVVIVLTLGILLMGYPGVIALSPQWWHDFVDGGRAILLGQVPRPLVVLISASLAGLFLWLLLGWTSAADTGRPYIILDDEGVTLFRLRGRPKRFAWSEVSSIKRRRHELRFLGGPSGVALLGGFVTGGQDLAAIEATIRHHRPDLGA